MLDLRTNRTTLTSLSQCRNVGIESEWNWVVVYGRYSVLGERDSGRHSGRMSFWHTVLMCSRENRELWTGYEQDDRRSIVSRGGSTVNPLVVEDTHVTFKILGEDVWFRKDVAIEHIAKCLAEVFRRSLSHENAASIDARDDDRGVHSMVSRWSGDMGRTLEEMRGSSIVDTRGEYILITLLCEDMRAGEVEDVSTASEGRYRIADWLRRATLTIDYV
ncbi:hypothetical protein Tco_0498866 [Tanacetum coccineum]